MPSNAKLLPYRSNIPELSKYCFGAIVGDFKDRALKNGGGFIAGGENCGQGSSREHAALVPLYPGIKAILAKSFARIHKDNLINSGILPLVFIDKNDYDRFDEYDEYDEIELVDLINGLNTEMQVSIFNITKGMEIKCRLEDSESDVEILKAGGYLNYMKSIQEGGVLNV